jgi:hypothetical protein
VTLDAAALLAYARRPAAELTRRDVARLMLSVPSAEALAAMPALRRELLAARNPLSAKFWESAEAILGRIARGNATVGEVHSWLEATGTEPTAIIGLHVWEEEPARTHLGHEMHDLLVAHLEKCLAAGQIDPDRLLTHDPVALEQYQALQERWLNSPLPDGRVPLDELLGEFDEDLLAEWNAAEQAALDELHDILADVGERPRPDGELAAACRKLRSALQCGGWPIDLLRAGGGVDPGNLDPDDEQLWLQLAAGVIHPVDDLPDSIPLDDLSATALEHQEWLWAVEALARGGPGTRASAEDLARFTAGASDNGDDSKDIEVLADWFRPVVQLWQLLGALDDGERLTALGWWGLPEALSQAWSSPASSDPADSVVLRPVD